MGAGGLLAGPEEKFIYIPQFVGGVTEGKAFTTTILITDKAGSGGALDPDGTRASATVESFDSMGNPSELMVVPSGSVIGPLDLASSQGVSLVGTTTRLVSSRPNVRFEDGTFPEVLVGWVRIRSEADLHVEAIVTIRDEDTGKIVTTVPVPATTAKPTWEFQADNQQEPSPNQETVGTGMALLFPPSVTNSEGMILKGGQKAMVEIRPRSGLSGTLIGEPIKIEVAPGEQISKFLHELAPGIRDFRGKVTVTSDLPVVVLPLVQEGLILTSQPVDGE